MRIKGKRKPAFRIQDVRKDKREFVETYLTPKGKRLMAQAKTEEEKEEIRAKYQKNRYRSNANSPILKRLVHKNY